MNYKQRVSWGKTRKKGKARFVIIYGMLIWGITFGVVSMIFSRIANNQFFLSSIFSAQVVFDLITRAAFGAITGIFFGIYVWRYMEKKWIQIDNGGVK